MAALTFTFVRPVYIANRITKRWTGRFKDSLELSGNLQKIAFFFFFIGGTQYASTHSNIADSLTKYTAKNLHNYLVQGKLTNETARFFELATFLQSYSFV